MIPTPRTKHTAAAHHCSVFERSVNGAEPDGVALLPTSNPMSNQSKLWLGRYRKSTSTKPWIMNTSIAANNPSVARRSVPSDCRLARKPHHTAIPQSQSVAPSPANPCSAATSNSSLCAWSVTLVAFRRKKYCGNRYCGYTATYVPKPCPKSGREAIMEIVAFQIGGLTSVCHCSRT